MSNRIEVPVVIVGGGPVGLSASIMLSKLGIKHILFEKHPGTSIHPKAVGLNQRTIEIFRNLGIEEEVYKIAAPRSTYERTAWYTSFGGPTELHGRQIAVRDAWGGGQYKEEYRAASPSYYTMLAQIRLEPLLRTEAEKYSEADLYFNTQVVDLVQDEDCVIVTAKASNDEVMEFTCQYVIGADGGRTVPALLNISFDGPTNLVDMVTAHFSADLSEYLPDDGCLINWFINPDLGGSIGSGYLYHLGPYDNRGVSKEWVFACGFAADDPARFNDDEMKKRINRSLGIPELEVELHSISHWYIQAVVAERFRKGRCFLVGDAAHRIPPWGALGLNSGIQDAHNLVWKLATVLNNPGRSPLLDTYNEERRPIAQAIAHSSLSNFQNHGDVVDKALGLTPATPKEEGWRAINDLWNNSSVSEQKRQKLEKALTLLDKEFHAHGVECGFSYPSGAISLEQVENQNVLPGDPLIYKPTTIPGHHLPHFWLDGPNEQISTVDLFTSGKFVLIVDEAEEEWRKAVQQLDSEFSDLLDVVSIGGDEAIYPDQTGRWSSLREVSPSGAIIVRPDKIVAWRSEALPENPRDSLTKALKNVFNIKQV
ncbi:FAD-binding monooxygenase [Halalkalibacter wakoensis JCM 9140]|uniref:FAD-binding monooxygenase n=1 Tax=Halalkalibacter wakoensis JCM 9140 TaxID=1236970 RepID=W4Q9B1_9BACI|nr:FAD-dependent monooxygenase [Halalkalibacter wakoensis]GAE28557.1 FAD-binding monooxygenase [Halalkalibacter wakoensis JCM 9140]